MKSDKALKKMLGAIDQGDLPYGFETRMMKQIAMVARKKKRRATILNMGLVSAVSLFMIAGAVFLLKSMFAFKWSLSLPSFALTEESKHLVGFFFYIAILMLLLLGFDYWMRSLKHKSDAQ